MANIYKNSNYKFFLLMIIIILLTIILIFEGKNIFFKKNVLNDKIVLREIPNWVEFSNKELSIINSENDESIFPFENNESFYDEKIPYKITLVDKKINIKFNDNTIWETDKNIIVQNFLWENIDENVGNELIVLGWEDIDNSFYQYIYAYNFLYRDINFINKQKFNNYIKNIIKNSREQVLVNYFDGNREILSIDKNKNILLMTPKFDFDENIDIINNKVLINAFGDNLVHSNIYKYGLRNNKNFDFLYENIKKENDNADISVINHETMLVNDYTLYSDYPKFGVPIGVGEAIIDAGFDIVTCATNHAIDKAEIGVNDTIDFYKKNNIICLGIHKLNENRVPYEIIEKNNIRFSLFNYTYGTNFGEQYELKYRCINTLQNKQQVIRDIKDGINKTDVSIVFVHWGVEYKNEITKFQKEWAKIFLDLGIDIVIGTHPHVLQNVEVLSNEYGNEMLIYYSLGNFISSQNTINTMVGGEAKIEILNTNNGIKILYDMIPVITHKEKGFITTYLLSDYNDDLLKKHLIKFDLEEINNYGKSFIK